MNERSPLISKDSRTEMWLFKFETVERARRAEIRDRPFDSSVVESWMQFIDLLFWIWSHCRSRKCHIDIWDLCSSIFGILVIGTYHWVNQWKQTENADWDSQLIYVNTFLK